MSKVSKMINLWNNKNHKDSPEDSYKQWKKQKKLIKETAKSPNVRKFIKSKWNVTSDEALKELKMHIKMKEAEKKWDYNQADTSVLEKKKNGIAGFGSKYIDNEMLIQLFGDLDLTPDLVQKNGVEKSFLKMKYGKMAGKRGWNLTSDARVNAENFKHLIMIKNPYEFINLMSKPYSGEVKDYNVYVKELISKPAGWANTKMSSKTGAYGDQDVIAMGKSINDYLPDVINLFDSFNIEGVNAKELLGRAASEVMDFAYKNKTLRNMKDLLYKGVDGSLAGKEKLVLKTYLVGSMLDMAGFDEKNLEELISVPTVKINVGGAEKHVRVLSEMPLSNAKPYIENYQLESKLVDEAGVAAYWLNNKKPYDNMVVSAVSNIAASASQPKNKINLEFIYLLGNRLVEKLKKGKY
ncbi:hypothetical protein GF352_03565 [archaeon]|nr:hypothetical protein [archaeon]